MAMGQDGSLAPRAAALLAFQAPLEGSTVPIDPPEVARWHHELADAMGSLDAMGSASLVVDAATGRVLGCTSATQHLLGTAPSHLADLVEGGLVARPDLERIRRWVADRRRADHRDRVDVETSHSLADRLHVHRGGRPPLAVEVSLVYHRRPRIGAEAVVASLRPLDAGEAAEEDRAHLPRGIWTLYDHELRVVATDPRLEDLGIDPRSQLGMPAATLTHPEDLPAVLEPVLDVLGGRARSTEIQIRAAVADGRWQQAVVELRRLETGGPPMVLGMLRFDRVDRRTIPAGLLSERQQVVVAALFDGKRVKDIARDEHVSERTVRNQLAAAYRKLNVAGQADLLSTYLRPSGS